MATGWSTTDLFNVTVSGADNLTATAPSDGGSVVRSVLGHSSGKWYAEVTITGTIGGTDDTPCIGLASSAWNYFNGVGQGSPSDSIGLWAGDSSGAEEIFYNNGFVNFNNMTAAAVSGDVVSICADVTNGRVYLLTNRYVTTYGANAWNASATAVDPNSATGAIAVSIGTPWHLVWHASRSGAIGTLNTGKTAFARTMPTGYSSWETWAQTVTAGFRNDAVLTSKFTGRLVAMGGFAMPHAEVLVPPQGRLIASTGFTSQAALTSVFAPFAGNIQQAAFINAMHLTASFAGTVPYHGDVGWSPTLNQDVTITGSSNQIATTGSTTFSAALSRTSHTTGKWYAEITIGGPVANGGEKPGVGIASEAWNLYNNPGYGLSSDSIAIYPGNTNQEIVINNAWASLGFAAAGESAGAVISIAVDFDAKLAWFLTAGLIAAFGANGWNGQTGSSPAAGTGGIPFTVSAPGHLVFAGDVAGLSGTLNTGGSAFARTMPSGFASWDNFTTTTWDSGFRNDAQLASRFSARVIAAGGWASPVTVGGGVRAALVATDKLVMSATLTATFAPLASNVKVAGFTSAAVLGGFVNGYAARPATLRNDAALTVAIDMRAMRRAGFISNAVLTSTFGLSGGKAAQTSGFRNDAVLGVSFDGVALRPRTNPFVHWVD